MTLEQDLTELRDMFRRENELFAANQLDTVLIRHGIPNYTPEAAPQSNLPSKLLERYRDLHH